jgi:hypothetical protein
LELHILRVKALGKPIFYDRGPCFNRYVGRGEGRPSAILSRTHLGPGSYYFYDQIRSGDEDGFESKASSTHYTIQTRTLDIPDSTMGYHGAKATLDLRTYLKPPIRQELRITPPFVYRTYEDLLEDTDPFELILNYTTDYLTNRLGWSIPNNPLLTNTIHFSFELRSLGQWIDDVLPCVDFLRREDGGEDSNFYIWLDNSQGEDRPELETSLKGIALDLFVLDSVGRSVA